MKNHFYVALVACILLSIHLQAKEYLLTSPDKHLRAEIRLRQGDTKQPVEWRLQHDRTTVLDWSAIGIHLQSGDTAASANAAASLPAPSMSPCTASVSRDIQPQLYAKRSLIHERYHSLMLDLGTYCVEWRLYNDGAAYRIIVTPQDATTRVMSETVDFHLADNYELLIPYENDRRGGAELCFSFESFYDHQRLSDMYADSLAITPLGINLPDGKRAILAETGLLSYPGLFLCKGIGNRLRGTHARVPLDCAVGGWQDYNLIPTRRADYIAQWTDCHDSHVLPWRIVGVFTGDRQIINSDLVYLLSPDTQIPDASWIQPGQSVWDWWNDWNLEGVDFQPGINNATYAYYADFAARYHIPYLIVDDGWSTHASLMECKEGIDIPALIDYATALHVNVILWASYRALMSDLEGQMKHYADLGVKGFKVDFFDRDDQIVIDDIERMAACAARHHLLLDLHGFKPTGIQRRWPNVVSFEGVKGLENFKWEPRVGHLTQHDHPLNAIESVFLRGLAGPMDYTPGSMNNATYATYVQSNHSPMSIGTRCNQLAMFVVMEAPLQMLADSPTRYEANEECTALLTAIPTTYDETVVLDAQMGEYIVVARRKANQWYLGAITRQARTITIDCSFLGNGNYTADIFCDTNESNTQATNYKRQKMALQSRSRIHLDLATAGGAVAIITPAGR